MGAALGGILINIISSAIWLALGFAASQAWQRSGRRKRARALTESLRRSTAEGAVALCVRVGGRADPLEDVRAYLAAKRPDMAALFVYEAPADADLTDPSTAEAVLADLRRVVDEFGQSKITELHLFLAGMVVFPFGLGWLLSNWGPVVVYLQQDGQYTPLYRISAGFVHRPPTTEPLSTLTEVDFRSASLVSRATGPQTDGTPETVLDA